MEWALTAALLVVTGMAMVLAWVNSMHRRDCEAERMQAFDDGRRFGVATYKEVAREARDDLAD